MSFRKTLIVAAIALSTGIALYELREASALRRQNQALLLEQEQWTARAQDAQMAREKIEAELAALRSEKPRVDRVPSELLRLRGEVGVWRQATVDLSNELHRASVNGVPPFPKGPGPYLGALEFSAKSPSHLVLDASNDCTITTTALPDGRFLLDMAITTRDSDQAPTPVQMIVTNDQQVAFQSVQMPTPVSFKARLKSE